MNNCTRCGTPIKGSAASFCTECKKPFNSNVKSQRKLPKKPTKAPRASKSSVKNFTDANYDGYYDDRLPVDAELMKDAEETDPEVIKRAILIAGGAFVFVILSIVIMYSL
jgi:hypothetical protein